MSTVDLEAEREAWKEREHVRRIERMATAVRRQVRSGDVAEDNASAWIMERWPRLRPDELQLVLEQAELEAPQTHAPQPSPPEETMPRHRATPEEIEEMRARIRASLEAGHSQSISELYRETELPAGMTLPSESTFHRHYAEIKAELESADRSEEEAAVATDWTIVNLDHGSVGPAQDPREGQAVTGDQLVGLITDLRRRAQRAKERIEDLETTLADIGIAIRVLTTLKEEDHANR